MTVAAERASGLKRSHFAGQRVLPAALLLPQFVILAVFFFIPSIRALAQAFLLADPFGNRVQFVWFDNFASLLASPEYQQKMAADPNLRKYPVVLDTEKKNLKMLADAGVRYGFGTDTGVPGRFHGYFEHRELETMVDAGLPGHWADLKTELATLGRSLDDVRGVVLTHGDSDHLGFAERLRRERGVPVFVHAADADRARGGDKPKTPLGPMRLAPTAGFFGKLFVFSAAIDAELYALTVIGLLNSILGAYYYLRVLVFMYFREPEPGAPVATPMQSGLVAVALVVAAVLVLLLGLTPSTMLEMARVAGLG